MNQAHANNRRLFEIAEGQGGLFTAKQAEQAGYNRTNHAYHVKAKNWVREDRGIYRLFLFPFTPDQQMVHYTLWSLDREEKIHGVYSHETALSYYELSDVNPSKLHMTVPKGFRRSAEIPKVLKLYHEDLNKDEIKKSRGYFITTPLRTIRDVIVVGETSLEFVEQAIQQALQKGLVRPSQLKALSINLKNNQTWPKEIDFLLKRGSI